MPPPLSSRPAATPRGSWPSGASGGLKETLDKLAAAVANLDGGGGSPLGGMSGGMPGTGGGLPAPGAAAKLGLAPFQALAAQINRTTAANGQAFADSLGQVQRSWKTATGQATQAWATSTASFQGKFGRATDGLARKFERGFDQSIGRVIHGVGRASVASAKVARQAWTHPVGYPVGLGRSAWGFGQNFASNWKHATPGGIPVGGTSGAWGSAAGLGWQNAARWAGVQGHAFGSGAKRAFRGGTRSLGRRFRYSKLRGGRAFKGAFARTGSARFAAGAAVRTFGGSMAMGAMGGGVGLAVTALTTAMNQLRQGFEEQNASNKHLGGYNGHIAGAFGQLALGDQMRNVKLAKATEGSAVTLANLTNKTRDTQASFDRISANLNNRVASGGAVAWNNLAKPYAMASDWLSGHMERMDPAGTMLAKVVDSPWALAAGVGGAIGALATGGNVNDAISNAKKEFERHEREALQANKGQLDAWAETMKQAQNMGPIRPAKQIIF